MKNQEKDPVCRMEISVNNSTLQLTYRGATYYFCSTVCYDQFEKSPENYATLTSECCKKDHQHHEKHSCCHNHS